MPKTKMTNKPKFRLIPQKRRIKGCGPQVLQDGDIVTLTFIHPNKPFTTYKLDHLPNATENNKGFTIYYAENITQNSLWIYRKIAKTPGLNMISDTKIHSNDFRRPLRISTKKNSPNFEKVISTQDVDLTMLSRSTHRQNATYAKETNLQGIAEKTKDTELSDHFNHYFEVCDHNSAQKYFLKIEDTYLSITNNEINIPVEKNQIELCVSSDILHLKGCKTNIKKINIDIKRIIFDDNKMNKFMTYEDEKKSKLNIYEYAFFNMYYKNDKRTPHFLFEMIPKQIHRDGKEEIKHILYHVGGFNLSMYMQNILSNINGKWNKIYCLDSSVISRNTIVTKPFTIFFIDNKIDTYEWDDPSQLMLFLNRNKSRLNNKTLNISLKNRDPNINKLDQDIFFTLFDLEQTKPLFSNSPIYTLKSIKNNELKLKKINNNKYYIKDDPKAIAILDAYINKYKLCSCTI